MKRADVCMISRLYRTNAADSADVGSAEGPVVGDVLDACTRCCDHMRERSEAARTITDDRCETRETPIGDKTALDDAAEDGGGDGAPPRPPSHRFSPPPREVLMPPPTPPRP